MPGKRHCRASVTLAAALIGLLLLSFTIQLKADSFIAFESGQVRPICLSPDGNRLYAVNTPDNRLEIFDVTTSGISHSTSVPVGLEPVAVAARNDGEVWVVNHLSDSISIIDTELAQPRVIRTLLVGDEPRDIVFAGPDANRAFITSAHRGQNSPAADVSEATGEARADVWVFNALNLGNSMGGDPLTVLTFFGDVPRALAVSPDKSTVYAAVFLSGNQTTVLGKGISGIDIPPPTTNAEGIPAPEQGMIVKYNGTDWVDSIDRIWSDRVGFFLPDWDIFSIDANSSPPSEINRIAGVGTVLFNMVVNPVNNKLYASNLESRNNVRFEGTGDFGGSTLRGHIAENRITIVEQTGNSYRHLNKHIDYDRFPGTNAEKSKSLAFPLDMAVTSDGSTLYVAAFGSSKIGSFKTAALEDDSFEPRQDSHIEVSGGGPSGLALDEARNKLYVLTRFDNSISIIDLETNTETGHVAMFNPEPVSITAGRPLLYDARFTSSRGDSACASCHIFGDLDALAWNLGDPEGVVTPNPNPFRRINPPDSDTSFHPMKGPMTTQSLRGMANHGPMHWRGDRADHTPGGDPLDENTAFKTFNVAFEGLLGRRSPLTDSEMQAFADFALQITYPPNPIRQLDNSLTASQLRGQDFYFNFPTSSDDTMCNTCHVVDPVAGFFGTDGLSNIRDGTQPMKIPHLRNVYTKAPILRSLTDINKTRGFGLVHDGSANSLVTFLQRPGFEFPGGNKQRVDVANFIMAMDSNLAPIVGQQITLTAANKAVVSPRISLLVQRAAVQSPLAECDLVVKGIVNNEQRGFIRLNNGRFRSDRQSEQLVPLIQLINLVQAPKQTMTFTCAPPGSGVRMAIDRDEDGFFDRDELDAGSDPADALSVP